MVTFCLERNGGFIAINADTLLGQSPSLRTSRLPSDPERMLLKCKELFMGNCHPQDGFILEGMYAFKVLRT